MTWPSVRNPRKRTPLSYDVGDQHTFQTRDFVFEQKLPLFQPLQFDLVERRAVRNPVDCVVQVVMFHPQRFETLTDVFLVLHACAARLLIMTAACYQIHPMAARRAG